MLSIVIPTLNEADNIEATLAAARHRANGEAVELIVSDCNSADGTAALARSLGASVACDGTCRADACNRGAALARGDVLLFLHADTLLPFDYARRINRVLQREGIVGGAFNFAFSNLRKQQPIERLKLRLVMLCNHIRYRWSRNFYGDQAIFVRRDIFHAVGGFPRRPLMEDLHFSRMMSRHGRTAILAPGIETSPRRFLMRGILMQLLIDMFLLSCDSFTVSQQPMWVQYNAWNKRRATPPHQRAHQ